MWFEPRFVEKQMNEWFWFLNLFLVENHVPAKWLQLTTNEMKIISELNCFRELLTDRRLVFCTNKQKEKKNGWNVMCQGYTKRHLFGFISIWPVWAMNKRTWSLIRLEIFLYKCLIAVPLQIQWNMAPC